MLSRVKCSIILGACIHAPNSNKKGFETHETKNQADSRNFDGRRGTGEWQFLGAGYIGPVPVPVIIMIVVVVISALIMNRTKMGRHIYAVGGNAQAAVFSGIKVSKVKFFVHAFSGVMAGLAGIILASRMYSGQPTAGEGAEMDAIAAVVVGGTSMSGGSGKIGGTVIAGIILASRMYSGQPTAGEGAEMDAIAAVVVGGTSMSGGSGKIGGTVIRELIIGILNNGLNLLNVNSFWQDVVKGILIILAVLIDYFRTNKK